MTTAGISGAAIALMGAGGLLAYSGLKNKSISKTAAALVTGANPATAADNTANDLAPGISNNVGSTSGVVSGVGGTPAQNKVLAQTMAAARGWTGAEWTALNSLWTRESGYDNTVANTSSGAYGIAQALPATKYPKAGQPASLGGNSDPGSQITWGLDYIAGRYGTPSAAWAHELANDWY